MSSETAEVSEPSLRTCWLLCACGVAVALIFWGRGLFTLEGVQDFTGFFVGTQLLGSSHLYSIPANMAVQKALTGYTWEALIFVRPPFFAAAMMPLTLIGYHWALLVWKILMLGCLAAFVRWLPFASARYAALAICWSFPANNAIAMGNDTPLLLALMVMALLCWKGGSPLLTGILLGLCLGKFHFLIFLPLLLFRRPYRRVLAGFSLVTAAAVTVNFLVQPDWMRLYWHALNMPRQNMNLNRDHMPDFYSAFFWTGHPAIGVAVGLVVVAVLLWPICRRFPFEIAMPICIIGGLLVAPHTNQLDAILALPALLGIASRYASLRFHAVLLASPAANFAYMFGPACLGPAMFVSGCAWLMWRLARTAPLVR